MLRTVLRDDQWDRIKSFLPGKSSDCGVTAKDNCLLRLYCGLSEQVPHGVIDPMILGIGTGCMSVTVAGLKKASGSVYLRR